MELILTDERYNDVRRLTFSNADFDIGSANDFELILPLEDFKPDIKFGCCVYVPGGECGGIITGRETNTDDRTVKLTGSTWRGMLGNRIIEPPAGSAYRVISGELNAVIGELINSMYGSLIVASEVDTGITVKYQFDRYTTVLAGLQKMLKQVGYKLHIEYVQQEGGAAGYAAVSAVPIIDYSQRIELSQDSRVNFTIGINNGTVNHLICLGKGELEQREVIHLYLQRNGEISSEKAYFGVDEIAAVYENSNSDDLKADGLEHYEELLQGTSLSMNAESLGIEGVEIGDIIGGRDYVTGMQIKKPLAGMIITANSQTSIQYKLEE